MNNLLSQLPDPQIKVQGDSVQTWQLNTYVDEDTRISRGDGGSGESSRLPFSPPPSPLSLSPHTCTFALRHDPSSRLSSSSHTLPAVFIYVREVSLPVPDKWSPPVQAAIDLDSE